MNKYVLYMRVSTDAQFLGLEAQRDAAHSYVQKNGGEIIAEYSEHVSGKIDDRAELNKALKLVEEENAILLIAKLDRLSRNVEFIFKLKNSGVNFVCCDIPELNTLTLGMFAIMAQHERETISQRIKESLAVIKKNGGKLGSPQNIVIHKEKAAENRRITIIKKTLSNKHNIRSYPVIAVERTKGTRWIDICRKLESEGYKTSQGNSNWCIPQVQRIYRVFSENKAHDLF